MQRSGIFGKISLIMVILFMLVSAASAIPPLPAEFYGSVALDGVQAPVGTHIEAKINGELRGEITTTETGTYGGSGLFDSRLVISATEDDVSSGNTQIDILINGKTADQSVAFEAGRTQQLDLSAGGGAVLPDAQFSADKTSGTAPLSVSFTDQSTGNPTSWLWEFGDGETSTMQNPVHSYDTAGLYDITLTVSNSAGSDFVTKENYISVSGSVPPPASVFSAEPRTGTAPLTVQFTDMSPGGPTAWEWEFGDGETSTLRNPVHTYTTAGSYDVTLEVSNSGGADSTTMKGFITVSSGSGIKANFNAVPTWGQAPLEVKFTDTSTGNPTMWNWNFGDGTTSTLANPIHIYSEPGLYTVSFTANDQYGNTDTIVRTDYIDVSSGGGIVADFEGSPRTGTAPLNVQFTDTSTGSRSMWNWNFGDGTTSSMANPAHIYGQQGTYTVTLTASNQFGDCDTVSKTNYICVSGSGGIKANFNAVPTWGQAPLEVKFTDTSTGNPTMWNWNFGDGTTSTLANPVHIYTEAGTYTVTLTASDQYGNTDTVTVTDCIEVTGVITADFTATPRTGAAPLNVQFTDTSTGNPTIWNWNFGDGATSNLADPVHIYTETGTYTVTLTASDQYGNSNTVTKTGYIEVTGTIAADFAANPRTGAAPLNVQFTDTSTGNPTMWNWNFGDGATSNLADPVHMYTEAGTYTVTFTASNQYGETDTIVRENCITVSDTGIPTAEFSASPTKGKAPLSVQFTDQSTGYPTSWLWDFGDGTTSTVKNPAYIYGQQGTYTVKLTVSNAAGQSTDIKENYITVSSQSPGAIIAVESDPIGTDVYIDGAYCGKTPLTSTGVSYSQHSIRLVRTGYYDWVKNVYPLPDRPANIFAALEPITTETGEISIQLAPQWSTVYLNGVEQGKTELVVPFVVRNLKPGVYELRITRGGFEDYTESVMVVAEKTTKILARMNRATGVYGTLMVDSRPPESTVFFDNSQRGITPLVLENIAPGEHTVKVTQPGFHDWQQVVNVSEGKISSVTAVLCPEYWQPSTGYLMVTSLPGEAQVYLDEEQHGTTPLTLSEIEPGQHTIRLEREGYKAWEQPVTIREGRTTYAIARMLE